MTVSVQVDGADREFVVGVGIHLFFPRSGCSECVVLAVDVGAMVKR